MASLIYRNSENVEKLDECCTLFFLYPLINFQNATDNFDE